MSDEVEEDEKPKKSKAMLFAIVGAVVLGGAGGFAGYSGMIPVPGLGGGDAGEEHASGDDHGGAYGDDGHGGSAGSEAHGPAAYVALDPITVNLGRGGRGGQLRIHLTVETNESGLAVIDDRKYRIVDVLNSFLRAVDEKALREPGRVEELRSRLLRRVQLDMPPGTVNNVLISEFVIL